MFRKYGETETLFHRYKEREECYPRSYDVRIDVSEQDTCASNCVCNPLLSSNNSAHTCDKFLKSLHKFCDHAPGGGSVGEEYEGYGRGGLCKSCSQTVDV